ncbi:MAG: hypothetical protein ACI81L_001395 [Verrucomicrobiales bacterium]|jgi:hypothetical protein
MVELADGSTIDPEIVTIFADGIAFERITSQRGALRHHW